MAVFEQLRPEFVPGFHRLQGRTQAAMSARPKPMIRLFSKKLFDLKRLKSMGKTQDAVALKQPLSVACVRHHRKRKMKPDCQIRADKL
jgi:DNA-binding NarL/FixJ family response regulator